MKELFACSNSYPVATLSCLAASRLEAETPQDNTIDSPVILASIEVSVCMSFLSARKRGCRLISLFDLYKSLV